MVVAQSDGRVPALLHIDHRILSTVMIIESLRYSIAGAIVHLHYVGVAFDLVLEGYLGLFTLHVGEHLLGGVLLL